MSKISESLQKASISVLLTMLVTALLTTIGIIWLYIQNPLVNILNERVPKSLLLLLAAVLLLLLLTAAAYIFYLRRKIKNPLEEYEFDEKVGILHSPKDNLNYCTTCFHNGIKSPLKAHANGWECMNKDCGKIYKIPEKKSEYEAFYPSKGNWLRDWKL